MRLSVFAFVIFSLFFTACSQNNVTEDSSFKKYFDEAGVTGSFGLFDNGQGHFTIYNLSRYRDSAYQPAATFDILQSLIAIQTGVVKDDSAVLLRDSVATDKNCAGTLTLKQAFQSDCLNGSMTLADRVGRDTLKKWIDSLHYGNKDMSGATDSFWFNNRLTITPDEELGLAKKLYFDQLPFFQHTQQIVRRMMLMENSTNYQLSYKTGRGIGKNGHAIGWVLGWVEENKHPYFFVLNIGSSDVGKDLNKAGMDILRGCLTQLGFFQGKK